MNIIQRIKEKVNKQGVITSRIPANRGHFLIPVYTDTKSRYRENPVTVLFKHAFVSGAILDSGNVQLAYDKVTLRSLANTGFSKGQIRKPKSCVYYSTKDPLQTPVSQTGATLLWIIHSILAPPGFCSRNVATKELIR